MWTASLVMGPRAVDRCGPGPRSKARTARAIHHAKPRARGHQPQRERLQFRNADIFCALERVSATRLARLVLVIRKQQVLGSNPSVGSTPHA